MKKGLLIGLMMIGLGLNAQVITNGLIGYYSLDGHANDSSANAFHGTVNGATPAVGINGQPNTCYDMTTGDIDIDHSLTIPDSSFTFSVWIKPDPQLLKPGPKSILELYEDSTNNVTSHFNLDVRNFGTDSAYFTPGCTLVVCSSVTAEPGCWQGVFSLTNDTLKIRNGEWNHLVYLFENDSAKIYLNDTLFASQQFILKYSKSYFKGAFSSWFPGSLDDVNLFSRALSPQERNQLYRKFDIVTTVEESSADIIGINFLSSSAMLIIESAFSIDKNVSLFDISGNRVLTEFVSGQSNRVKLNGIKKGVYVVSVEMEEGSTVKKILIQ